VWNTIFVYAGYALGEQWHVVEEYAGVLQKVVIAVVAAAVVWFVVTRVWRWVHDDERPAHARGGRSSAPARDDA
jgi:membrane protein DedA with SNARE-associated domain